MENYRTFVGIPLKVDLAFLASRDRLVEALSGERISWVIPKNYHLTLRFIGDTPPDQLDQLREAFRLDFSLRSYHEQCLAGPGVFGPLKKPRVIWVGFSDPAYFMPLKEETDRLLASCGIPPALGEFNPHLTLGRIRGLKNLNAFYEILESFKGDFRSRVFADRLHYYRSELTPQGPRYSVLEELVFSS